MKQLTSHPEWLENILAYLKPFEDRVVEHRIFVQLRVGELPVEVIQRAQINFYPLIRDFPTFMTLNLKKIPKTPATKEARSRHWLIANIRQERQHAKWWRMFAEGFGVSQKIFDNPIHPPTTIDKLNKYMRRVCSEGSVSEGLAAANYAVEGPTGQWTKNVKAGFEYYRGKPGVEITDQTLEWISAHAAYDDKHPLEALEMIKAFAITTDQREKVKFSAERALEYYALALDAC